MTKKDLDKIDVIELLEETIGACKLLRLKCFNINVDIAEKILNKLKEEDKK